MDISVIQNKLRTYNESKKNYLANIEKLKNAQTKYVTQLDMYEKSLISSKESLIQAFKEAGITINNIDDIYEINSAMDSVMQNINKLMFEINSYNVEIDKLLR